MNDGKTMTLLQHTTIKRQQKEARKTDNTDNKRDDEGGAAAVALTGSRARARGAMSG